MQFRARSKVVVGPNFLIRLRLRFREHFNCHCTVHRDLHPEMLTTCTLGRANCAGEVALRESRFSCHSASIAAHPYEGKKKGQDHSCPCRQFLDELTGPR